MTASLTVSIDAFRSGDPIPEEYAFCVPATDGHVAMGRNRNPHVRWSNVPGGTRSFAVICHDPDVPSKPDAVNKEGMTVPADLPRVNFYHWVLVDIPVDRDAILAGEDSQKITPGGKPAGETAHGLRGINSYTGWFAADEEMKGDYGGYDGPCPPWNDEIIHHYHFTIYALDVPRLRLGAGFDGAEAEKAMEGHVLARGTWVGTYTLNRALRGK